MDEYEVQGVNINDLIAAVKEDIKEDAKKNFEDLLLLDCSLNRNIFLGSIDDGIGLTTDNVIRFWNRYDEKHNIPIEKRQPIKIIIDSMGGCLTDTLTIVDSIKMSKTPVYTICVGAAYSGGFFTFISGHKRFAYPHASFLFHEGSTSTGGTSGQFENYTAFYKKQLNQLKDIVLQNSKISDEEYEKFRRDDVWYDVQEGIEKGFVDAIAEGI